MKRGWILGGSALALVAAGSFAATRPNAADAPKPAAPVATGVAGLYAIKCGVCHAAGATPGYLALKQMGQAEPDLDKRADLDPEYVKTVVRNGVAQMPPMTPGYISDRELDAIAHYLAAKK